MGYCSLERSCIEPRMQAQVAQLSAVPDASALTEAGRARLADLTRGGRHPSQFEVIELNLKGRAQGGTNEPFDGYLYRTDVMQIVKAAQVNPDRFIQDMVAGGFMSTYDPNESPRNQKISAAQWDAVARAQTPAPIAPRAPTGVNLRRP